MSTENVPTTIAGLLNSEHGAEVCIGRRSLIVKKLAPMKLRFEVYEAKHVGAQTRRRIHEGDDESKAVRALVCGDA